MISVSDPAYRFAHAGYRLPKTPHLSVPKHPARDAGIAPIPAVLRERLLVPERVRRRPVGQFQQQRGADVVGTVGRADRPAEDEAVADRRSCRR